MGNVIMGFGVDWATEKGAKTTVKRVAKRVMEKATRAAFKKVCDKAIPVYGQVSLSVDAGNAFIGCTAGCAITNSYEPPSSPLSIWSFL